MALCRHWPVVLSQRTVVSLWLVIPIPLILLRPSPPHPLPTSSKHTLTESINSWGSCSNHLCVCVCVCVCVYVMPLGSTQCQSAACNFKVEYTWLITATHPSFGSSCCTSTWCLETKVCPSNSYTHKEGGREGGDRSSTIHKGKGHMCKSSKGSKANTRVIELLHQQIAEISKHKTSSTTLAVARHCMWKGVWFFLRQTLSTMVPFSNVSTVQQKLVTWKGLDIVGTSIVVGYVLYWTQSSCNTTFFDGGFAHISSAELPYLSYITPTIDGMYAVEYIWGPPLLQFRPTSPHQHKKAV